MSDCSTLHPIILVDISLYNQETFVDLFLPSKLAQWRVGLYFAIHDKQAALFRRRVDGLNTEPVGALESEPAVAPATLKRTVTAADLDEREELPALDLSFTSKPRPSLSVDETGSESWWEEEMERQVEHDRKYGRDYEPVAHRTRHLLSSPVLARKAAEAQAALDACTY